MQEKTSVNTRFSILGKDPDTGVVFKHPVGLAVNSVQNIFVTDSEQKRVLNINRNGKFNTIWGEGGTVCKDFSSLGGISFSEVTGLLYFIDTIRNNIEIYNKDGEHIRTWTHTSDYRGFQTPRGITIGNDGKIYVADEEKNRVQIFDKREQYVSTWTGPTGQFFDKPIAIECTWESKIISLLCKDRVWILLLSTGTVLRSWGKKGTGEKEMNDPHGICIGRNAIAVADTGNNRVQKFDIDGKYIKTYHDIPGSESLERPTCVVFGVDGELYVADSNNKRIVVIEEISPYG